MSLRNTLILLGLVAAAVGSWLLSANRAPDSLEPVFETDERSGYYIKGARLRGIGPDGQYQYILEAGDALQDEASGLITVTDVALSYTESSAVPWTLHADSGVIDSSNNAVQFSGNVKARGEGANLATVLETDQLSFDPERQTIETDTRVTLRVGSRAISATGMLAFLEEDKIEFKSNVSGKFLP